MAASSGDPRDTGIRHTNKIVRISCMGGNSSRRVSFKNQGRSIPAAWRKYSQKSADVMRFLAEATETGNVVCFSPIMPRFLLIFIVILSIQL